MADLWDEFFSLILIIFLVLSTIFSLVFIAKLSAKIPNKTRRWMMYPLYFGLTYLIASLTHAAVGAVILAYVPALVAMMFDDFETAIVVWLIKPVITLSFLVLVAPGEVPDLKLSFEISWITLLIVLWVFYRFGRNVWVYYGAAIMLGVLEDEFGLLGPLDSEFMLLANVVGYIVFVGFMLYLNKQILADEEAYLEKLNTDPLTGLFNLRAFQQDVADLRDEQEYVILIMDVDKFKQLNDTLGHATGNVILKAVADKAQAVLAMNFAEIDYKVYRFGGEELICVVQNRGSVCRLLLEMRTLFTQLNEDLMGDMQNQYEVPVTFSAGVSSSVWNSFDEDATFKKADRLLYQAKQLGGAKIALDEHFLDCEKCKGAGLIEGVC